LELQEPPTLLEQVDICYSDFNRKLTLKNLTEVQLVHVWHAVVRQIADKADAGPQTSAYMLARMSAREAEAKCTSVVEDHPSDGENANENAVSPVHLEIVTMAHQLVTTLGPLLAKIEGQDGESVDAPKHSHDNGACSTAGEEQKAAALSSTSTFSPQTRCFFCEGSVADADPKTGVYTDEHEADVDLKVKGVLIQYPCPCAKDRPGPSQYCHQNCHLKWVMQCVASVGSLEQARCPFCNAQCNANVEQVQAAKSVAVQQSLFKTRQDAESGVDVQLAGKIRVIFGETSVIRSMGQAIIPHQLCDNELLFFMRLNQRIHAMAHVDEADGLTQFDTIDPATSWRNTFPRTPAAPSAENIMLTAKQLDNDSGTTNADVVVHTVVHTSSPGHWLNVSLRWNSGQNMLKASKVAVLNSIRPTKRGQSLGYSEEVVGHVARMAFFSVCADEPYYDPPYQRNFFRMRFYAPECAQQGNDGVVCGLYASAWHNLVARGIMDPFGENPRMAGPERVRLFDTGHEAAWNWYKTVIHTVTFLANGEIDPSACPVPPHSIIPPGEHLHEPEVVLSARKSTQKVGSEAAAARGGLRPRVIGGGSAAAGESCAVGELMSAKRGKPFQARDSIAYQLNATEIAPPLQDSDMIAPESQVCRAHANAKRNAGFDARVTYRAFKPKTDEVAKYRHNHADPDFAVPDNHNRSATSVSRTSQVLRRKRKAGNEKDTQVKKTKTATGSR
jgi:hypothetical protein